MQSLFADIPAFNQKQNSLSGHDQVTEILVKKIKLPVEVVDKVFCFVPTTYLIDVLGARFDQIPIKKVTFQSFKNELGESGGYSLDSNKAKLILM